MASQPARTLALVSRGAPYASHGPRLCLDLALAAAVFETARVQVVFMDDGIYQLLPGQAAEAIGRKSVEKLLASLEQVDVHDFFVDSQSLAARQLELGDIDLPVAPLREAELRKLLATANCVLTF